MRTTKVPSILSGLQDHPRKMKNQQNGLGKTMPCIKGRLCYEEIKLYLFRWTDTIIAPSSSIALFIIRSQRTWKRKAISSFPFYRCTEIAQGYKPKIVSSLLNPNPGLQPRSPGADFNNPLYRQGCYVSIWPVQYMSPEKLMGFFFVCLPEKSELVCRLCIWLSWIRSKTSSKMCQESVSTGNSDREKIAGMKECNFGKILKLKAKRCGWTLHLC